MGEGYDVIESDSPIGQSAKDAADARACLVAYYDCHAKSSATCPPAEECSWDGDPSSCTATGTAREGAEGEDLLDRLHHKLVQQKEDYLRREAKPQGGDEESNAPETNPEDRLSGWNRVVYSFMKDNIARVALGLNGVYDYHSKSHSGARPRVASGKRTYVYVSYASMECHGTCS